MLGTQEVFDALSTDHCKNEQGSAPPRATDIGWAHGLMVNGDRQKIQCKYCHKVILGGGISRLKQHLAGERGNIAPCEKVPEEVKVQMQQHLGFKVMQRLKKHKESERVKNPLMSSMQGMEEGNYDDMQNIPKASSAGIHTGRLRKKEGGEATSGRGKRHRKQSITCATPVNHNLSFASQESLDRADMAVAKFMYTAGIPFSAANSAYFQLMADAIAAVGPGYRMPSYHSLRYNLLNKSVQEAGDVCLELRKSWEVTGCSIMVDKWTYRTGCTVVNFYIYCPKGTMFLKSFDASEVSKSKEELYDLFDSVVQDVGPKNVVHFVTDTTANYKAAGKMLMSKYGTFFWSASSAHCIYVMLEELGKMIEVKEVLSKAKRVCQFIYNHEWLLNFVRKRTGGREIVRPSITRCMTDVLTLQSIMSLKDPLHQMFTSTTWMQSDLSKRKAGLEVTDIVVDPLFWSMCDQVLKVTDPLLSVLCVADNDAGPSLGYIYNAMEKAKKEIVMAFNDTEAEYFPYIKLINRIWEEKFHSPLHAAAYYLNPSLFYNPSFSTNKLIQKGLLDCIETLEPNVTIQDMITRQINSYEDAIGDFSRPMALRGRENVAPATWWSLYAADYPDLQRFAVRILSQTCSVIKCERNWNMLECTHPKKNSRLEDDKLDNLIFVHYNLRLKERQSAVNKSLTLTEGIQDRTCLEGMGLDVGDWIEYSSSLDRDNICWTGVEVPDDSIFVDNSGAINVENSGYSSTEGSSESTNSFDEYEDF